MAAHKAHPRGEREQEYTVSRSRVVAKKTSGRDHPATNIACTGLVLLSGKRGIHCDVQFRSIEDKKDVYRYGKWVHYESINIRLDIYR